MTSLVDFADPPPPGEDDRPAADRCPGPPPLRTTFERYAADGGGISIGEWRCAPGAWRIAFHGGRHEFFHVLEGCIRITGEDGAAREFGPGDACVIPAGFRGLFEVLAPVRKRYVMLDRNK